MLFAESTDDAEVAIQFTFAVTGVMYGNVPAMQTLITPMLCF